MARDKKKKKRKEKREKGCPLKANNPVAMVSFTF
jgi:hypothetical protein